MEKNYDKYSPYSIENYGKKMVGLTFRQIYEMCINGRETDNDYISRHADKKYKGGLGNLIEECYFGYKANSSTSADFEEAGVELKVTPYKKTIKGYKAKERLVITMINYMEDFKEHELESSHLWKKIKLMLLVWYLHTHGKNDIDSTIDFVSLFSVPYEDLEIIREDYRKIINKIKCGKAHELSEGDTLYLGACTKGASSKQRRVQPFSDIMAKPRAFSLKNSYMTYVLNHYIIPNKNTYEPIVKQGTESTDFEKYVTEKINRFAGTEFNKLCQIFSVSNKSKNIASTIAFRILGVKSNNAAEFEKAGIALKTIHIGKNGKIREHMSFPAFKYRELAEETWENSTFGNYLRETRFFFVIYKTDTNNVMKLAGSQFWNMPLQDIDGDVHDVWQEMHDIVKNGQIRLTIDDRGHTENNFPKIKHHKISHVRPHAKDKNDCYPLPAGTKLNITSPANISLENTTSYIKHCFWLNNSYIYGQLEERFK